MRAATDSRLSSGRTRESRSRRSDRTRAATNDPAEVPTTTSDWLGSQPVARRIAISVAISNAAPVMPPPPKTSPTLLTKSQHRLPGRFDQIPVSGHNDYRPRAAASVGSFGGGRAGLELANRIVFRSSDSGYPRPVWERGTTGRAGPLRRPPRSPPTSPDRRSDDARTTPNRWWPRPRRALRA